MASLSDSERERTAVSAGVQRRRKVDADGSTVLLDEIGDMPLALQPKLLRVLQFGEVRPVGGDRMARVDVRIIAATHRDLDVLVEEGLFRQDLRYRLNVIPLHVPRSASAGRTSRNWPCISSSKRASDRRCPP